MVSPRCKMMVKSELEKMKIIPIEIDLGLVIVEEELNQERRDELNKNLLKSGLELLDDKKSILIEKIKTLIIEMIHYPESDKAAKLKFSNLLADTLGYDYTYLSNVFSEVKGINIERYIISNKVEQTKELILYGELSLSEIANKLHYSSVAHLSGQFKKVTGLTPSYFKQLAEYKKRISLEDL